MNCSIIRNKETKEIERVNAPNGKESILYKAISDLQPDKEEALKSWAQVYTPSFKEWFGDWEKGEGSKVVDENGEPLLAYHGSDQTFDTFDPNAPDRASGTYRLGKMFYFSNQEFVANSYTGYREINWDRLSDEGIDIENEETANKIINERKESVKNASILPVFLNLRNPYIIDNKEAYGQNQSRQLSREYDKLYGKTKTVGEETDKQNKFKKTIEETHDGIIFTHVEDHTDTDGRLKDVQYDDEVPFNTYGVKAANAIKSIFNQGTFSKKENNIYLSKGNLHSSQEEAYDILQDENIYGRNLSQYDIERINKKLARISNRIGDTTWSLKKSSKGNWYVAGHNNWDVTRDTYFSPHANGLFRQKEVVPVSRASEATLSKVKDVIKKMGVSVQALSDYLKGNPDIEAKGSTGLADLIHGIIAVAQGKEDVALTEEMVHVATAMLEQSNPQLITELISKIDRFKIYKTVLNAYKSDKNYQLSDGKPDIRKLKKEAVDKLIAEVIINKSEGSTEFPELMQEENRSLVRRMWDAVMDFIRKTYRNADIDIFEQAAEKVMSTEEAPKGFEGEGIYLQKEAQPLVDRLYNEVVSKAKRMKLFPAIGNTKRHYTFDGKEVANSVTEIIKREEERRWGKRDEFKVEDDVFAQWGTSVHDYIQNYITANKIDKDGYKRTASPDEKIKTDLPDTVVKALNNYIDGLIDSYSDETRFIIESMVINEKYKGMLGSAIDFMAIEPTLDKDGKPDVKVDILDWKSLRLDKSKNKDINWYKQEEWNKQMSHYSRIIQNYGVKQTQIRKTRMVPFVINYQRSVAGDNKSKLVPQSMEIGKVDSTKETSLYLLPVALSSETTGNKRIDNLVNELRLQYKKMYDKRVPFKDRFKKIEDLAKFSAAIRHLQIALNFEPLLNVGMTFLQNAAKAFESFKGIDYSLLSKEEISTKLDDLISYKESAEKFTELDEVFLSQYPKDNLDKKDTEILTQLSKIAQSTKRMLNDVEDLQREYVMQLALKEGVVLNEIETEKGIKIMAEAALGTIEKAMSTPSHLAPKLIRLVTKLIVNSKNLVNIEYSKKMKKFDEVFLEFDKEAKAKGVDTFSQIGKINNENLELFKKLDRTFWDTLIKAREEGNKKYLVEKMDEEKFKTLSKELIDKQTKEYDETQFSIDEKENTKLKKEAIRNLKNSIDIYEKDFHGYTDRRFMYLYNQCIKEEGHLSKEYSSMSENAKKVWEMFVALNEETRNSGYQEKGKYFFPLIEATTLQKFYQAKDKNKQLKEFFTDMFTVKVNEENTYAKKDSETGKPTKKIPKYFTRTDKSVDQLSKDVGRVYGLYLKAALEFKEATETESVLQTISDIERTKGTLVLDNNGHVQYKGDVPLINYSENKNADIIEGIINDHLYRIEEDLTSLGNVNLTKLINKFSKDEESRETKALSIRKAMHSADTLVRIQGVGLKPLIAAANWTGYQFQTFIQSGNFYKFGEFQKNNTKIMTGVGLSTIERALLDTVIPFNENVAHQEVRKLGKKRSYIDYLNTWGFVDIMMITNSFPERRLQYANAQSFIENSMVKDGKIVNIRQYLKKEDGLKKYEKDAEGKYIMPFVERKALERSFEERVKKLKETVALKHISKIVNDEVVIEGISEATLNQALAEFRTQIISYQNSLNGQMTEGDKEQYRRDTIFKSFMMFKTWIPPLVTARTGALQKNALTNDWEYGRTRAFIKVWSSLGKTGILKMNDIIKGTDKGLEYIHEILEAKKLEHFRKTGQELEITEEEFNDLIRRELVREFKELGMLVGVVSVVLAAGAAKPPDDATEYEKNRYKWWARAVNKISQEITFYYDPTSMEAVTRGSIMPSLGLLFRVEQLMVNLEKETKGYILNDESMIKKAYPVKYFLNLVPMGAQFQNEVLPYLFPDIAKEMGIRVTTQARGR